ncbi:MAG: hypothetical protein PCFJNLEI_01998 [Verrucomicrobiae bacterium]|nr:hypothetical protein [Verrucomicrobiae bacterium]
MFALGAHVAGGVDVVNHHVPAILVEGDLGAEEIELGDFGDDADDAFQFGHVDEPGIRGCHDGVPVGAVVPPAGDGRAADEVDAEPGATFAKDLRFDGLLDEVPLVAMLRAGMEDIFDFGSANQDAPTTAAFGRFDDERFGKTFDDTGVNLRLAFMWRKDEGERELQAGGEEIAVDFGFVAGAEVFSVSVQETGAVGGENVVELEEMPVFVAGAVEKPIEPAFAIVHFERGLGEVVRADDIAGEAGMVQRPVKHVDEIGVVLPVVREADVMLGGAFRNRLHGSNTARVQRLLREQFPERVVRRELRGIRRPCLRSCG